MDNQAYPRYSSEQTPLPTIANSNNLPPISYTQLPPVNQPNYGYGPPPPNQYGYGPPPPNQNGYGPPPPNQNGYGPPPPNQNGVLPPSNRVYPSNTVVGVRKGSSICSPKCVGIVAVCMCIVGAAVIAIVLAIVLPRLTSISGKCADGYAILDCTLECGKATVANSYNRIVGGNEAVAHSWPSIVYVVFQYSAYVTINGQTFRISSSSSCGGTLIGKGLVLTAAHCISTSISYTYNGNQYSYTIVTNSQYPTMGSMYTVYLGAHDITNLNSAVSRSVSKVVKHTSYDDSTFMNDIALLHLSKDVTLTDNIQVACLPNEYSTSFPSRFEYPTVYAAGWGTLSSGGVQPDKLQDVYLSIYSDSACSGVGTTDSRKQMCVGDLSGTRDTCQGDSGGPIYIKQVLGGQSKYVSVGIVSYGIGCATPNLPAIYVRNSYYYNWIRENSSHHLTSNSSLVLLVVMLLALI